MAVKLSKIMPWSITVVLLATSSVSAQQRSQRMQKADIDQSHQVAEHQMMSAYNAPARIDVRGSWDFFFTGTFIYWQPRQEGMEFTLSSDVFSPPVTGGIVNGKLFYPDFKYKPGFKVGIGMNTEHDDWDIYAEYTRMHGTHSGATDAPVVGGIFGNLTTLWLTKINSEFQCIRATARWQLNLDFLDLELARSYYNGRSLTFRAHFGARAAWIKQRYRTRYTETPLVTVTAQQRTSTWALGPRAGVDGSWILGKGFRIIGNAAADLLYTRYKFRKTEEDRTDTSRLFARVNDRFSYLRPHFELQWGFGWGTYFNNKGWHFDLAATYDFHVFWNQNAFWHAYDEVSEGGFVEYAFKDLFVHGLTLSLRFDF